MEKIVPLIFLLVVGSVTVCLTVSLFSLNLLQKIGATRTPLAPFARCTFEAIEEGLLISWNYRLAAIVTQIVFLVFALIWLLR